MMKSKLFISSSVACDFGVSTTKLLLFSFFLCNSKRYTLRNTGLGADCP